MVLPTSQKAIRLHSPHIVQLDDIPVPKIEHPDDAIVKVLLAGLCGSDLHPYRGLEKLSGAAPFVMGHELYGEIVQLGSSFASTGGHNRPKGYSTYQVGMKVIATFSVSCLECEYCAQGFTSRCKHSQLLGSPVLPGAQAQYVRIPKAGGTLIAMESSEAGFGNAILPPTSAILLADILPTGYFAAMQAFGHPNLSAALDIGPTTVTGNRGYDGMRLVDRAFVEDVVNVVPDQGRVITFAVIGLGPVGVCALVALVDFMLLHLDATSIHEGQKREIAGFKIYAIDLLEPRRDQARSILERLKDSRVIITASVDRDLEGRPQTHGVQIMFRAPDTAPPDSCHAVLEVVGHPSSLLLSSALSRPFGIISSVGVHSKATNPLPPPLLYDKNLSFAFGRCPVRALLRRSKALLERRVEMLDGFIDPTKGIVGFGMHGSEEDGQDAVRAAYQRFESGEGGKICFDPWK